MDLYLQNQIVVITGVSAGIGNSLCKAFLLEGSYVVGTYRKSNQFVQSMLPWLEGNNIPLDRFHVIQLDIQDKDQVMRGFEEVYSKFKRIDILINNAGNATEMPFFGLDEDQWHQDIDLNINGTARIIRNVLPNMVKLKRGNIINISSLVGSKLGRGISAYAAAKSAINRLTQVLAIEMASKGIRVNAIAPGIIETNMSRNLIKLHGEKMMEMCPMKRWGTPEDIANMALFLASDRSSYITGQIFNVDGGIGI